MTRLTPELVPQRHAPIADHQLPRYRRRSRLTGLDGIRGLAVIAVIVFHAAPAALPGGFVGVDLFFVLSGFLITRSLLGTSYRGAHAFGVFWASRARRILPPLLAMVSVVTAVVAVTGGDLAAGLQQQLIGAATFSSNWAAIVQQQDYFAADAPEVFKHLWSLAVEEQFYLVWPLVVLLLLRRRASRAVVAVVQGAAVVSAAAMALLALEAGIPRVYYGTDTHAFGLLIGAAVALAAAVLPAPRAVLEQVLAVLGAAVMLSILSSAATGLDGTASATYTGPLQAVSAATGVLLLAVVRGPDALGRVLDVGPLAWVGRRSYGLYLWHWPLLSIAFTLTPNETFAAPARVAAVAAAVLVTVLCAAVSFALVERPRRAGIGGRPQPRRLLGAALAATAVAATVGIALQPARSDAAEQYVARGQAALKAHHDHPPVTRPSPTVPSTAEPSATPSTTAAPAPSSSPVLPADVTAIGDSVMLASAPELLDRFPEARIDAVVSRQPSAAPAILEQLRAEGRLQQFVVVGLGTNGALGRGTLSSIRRAIGDRDLVLVDVHADRPWVTGVNDALQQYACAHRRVTLAQWNERITGRAALLANDGIHPGAAGGRIYADAVADAVKRLQQPAATGGCA